MQQEVEIKQLIDEARQNGVKKIMLIAGGSLFFIFPGDWEKIDK